jgi:hypothetical protein
MLKRLLSTPANVLYLIPLLVSVLIGCTIAETSSEEPGSHPLNQDVSELNVQTNTPSPTLQITPTRTLDLFRPDTVRATYAAEATRKAAEPTSTPRSSSTPTLSPQQLCRPFADDIQYLGSTKILGYPAWTLQTDCKGERNYFRSPVGDMTLFDYTALTGRFAYGPADPKQSGLWVYDYWIELSEKWFDDHVIEAEWSPVKSPEDVQILVILNDSGTLFVLFGPFQTEPIASEVKHFSVSPQGDQVAYVKRNTLYVIPIRGGQSRKLAEGAFGTPRWAIAENSLIIPSSPIKIAFLDGSGAFIPLGASSITERIETLCDGKRSCALSSNIEANHVLWDEKSHLLVFYAYEANDEENFRTVYAYELSEDLRKIVNRQAVFGDFTNRIQWDTAGESIIDSAGNKATLGSPHEIFTVHAKIISVEETSIIAEFMWTNPWNTHRYGHQFVHVRINDQSQIVDINGQLTTMDPLRPGMTIKLTARKLSPYTLSLFAYKILISCDLPPCYLGYEG